MHLWRQVLEQKGEGLVNRLGINYVVVVKDEDEILRSLRDFVDEGRQDRFGWQRLRRLQEAQRPGPQVGVNGL
jgi:hypothetical protein